MAQTISPSERGRGRPKKLPGERSRNAGFAAYPPEIRAIRKVAKAKNFAAPFDYGSAVIVPVATELIRRYPRIEVVLNLSDRTTKPQENDLAIRVGWSQGFQ